MVSVLRLKQKLYTRGLTRSLAVSLKAAVLEAFCVLQTGTTSSLQMCDSTGEGNRKLHTIEFSVCGQSGRRNGVISCDGRIQE